MANLQEEIFESEDFKEDDLKDNTDENNIETQEQQQQQISSNVIEEEIKPSAAFQIYAGQLYDPLSSQTNNNNNKDNNNIGKSSRIYDTTQSKDINFESPLQTYKRLQFEIESFKQKLQEITEKV